MDFIPCDAGRAAGGGMTETMLDLAGISHSTPVKTRKQIVSFLRIYLCFVHYSIAAVEAFLDGRLEQFDAHIGETACQIRAYRVLLLYYRHNKRSIEDALSALKRVQSVILSHIELGLPAQNCAGGVRMLLKDLDAELVYDKDMAFLLATYFLKQFSAIDDERAISCIRVTPETLPEGLSRRQFEISVKRFQRKAAEDSCKFILGLLPEVPELASLGELAAHFLKRDEMDREVLPAFLSGHVIFRHLLAHDLPAALIVFVRKGDAVAHRFHYSLKPDGTRGDFEIGLEPDLDVPCLIMKGELRGEPGDKQAVRKHLASYGMLRALDAFMAAHCQYSGNHLKNSNDIMEQLSLKHSEGHQALALLCRRYEDWLWFGKKIIGRRFNAFLLRHIFSGRLSGTI
jgi:hypothetical protein